MKAFEAVERATYIVNRIADAREGIGTAPTIDEVNDILTGAKCWYCEARPGDNDYCVADGSPHPWVTVHNEQEQSHA